MKIQKEKLIHLLISKKNIQQSKTLRHWHICTRKRFFHDIFSDKLKPLRIGSFKIINKTSDITYEIVNQNGYTSHIHRNHLVPYYPKEPIVFPFIQQYNPHSNDDDNDNNDSNINDPIKPLILFPMENHQLKTKTTHSQIPIKKRNYHPQLTSNQNHLVNILHFRTNKIHQKLITLHQKIKLIFTITIILFILEDTPIIDTISAHNHDYRLFLGEKDIMSLSQKSC